MAFSFGESGGSGKFGRRYGAPPIAEMNIIPLVDVVLVLLIIFMLTASVMEFGLDVEVPKVRQVRDTAQERPVVTVSKEGELYLNDQPVNLNSLGEDLRTKFAGNEAVYLRADRGAVWEIPVQVMSILGQEGFKVNVVTQPEDETGRRR